jgi:hypothetical protein
MKLFFVVSDGTWSVEKMMITIGNETVRQRTWIWISFLAVLREACNVSEVL